MTITKQTLAERISSYSCHDISLAASIGITDKNRVALSILHSEWRLFASATLSCRCRQIRRRLRHRRATTAPRAGERERIIQRRSPRRRRP